MIEKAVIDQIVEGKKAVLLIGEKEEVWAVDLSQIPGEVHEGLWVAVEIKGDTVTVLNIDLEETERNKKRINDKLEQLRLREGSTYKKK